MGIDRDFDNLREKCVSCDQNAAVLCRYCVKEIREEYERELAVVKQTLEAARRDKVRLIKWLSEPEQVALAKALLETAGW